VEAEEDFVVRTVMEINQKKEGAFIASSGKNMGIFKGVGYPEEIAEFYRLEEYRGHLWTAHGRFPTNTPGWWGGAHPFGLLDWSVVHNGEISSYGTNRRYLKNFGYDCAFYTDTEVVTYLFDLLHRKHQLAFPWWPTSWPLPSGMRSRGWRIRSFTSFSGLSMERPAQRAFCGDCRPKPGDGGVE